jgi:type I restriction enzyme M protein
LPQNSINHARLVALIWSIADDVLRDLYVRGKYRDVILPFTVLRRLDSVLEPTQDAVLAMKRTLDQAGIVDQDAPLRDAAKQDFYNTSGFTLKALRHATNATRLRQNFEAYLDGFSPNVQEIIDNFEFRNQLPRLTKADALGALIEKFLSPDLDLSPAGLDNHGMGTVFEELVRRFNEENNEEAGEHWTPRDAVRLMTRLMFEPISEVIPSGTYRLYDGAMGTGGMLTVAEETLKHLTAPAGKKVSTHLYGQEINAETYAIAKADLILKGEGMAADNIVGGPEWSTLSNDAFAGEEFDFMLSNPPYGKSWKTDQDRLGGAKKIIDPRFIVTHGGDPDYSMVTRSSDGQLMFLANLISKMKQGTRSRFPHRIGAQRLLAVHRRRRSGREQLPSLDHRERLARSHRRPAAQDVLQHRYRDLCVGDLQPQGRAPQGQGATHRRHQLVHALAQEPRREGRRDQRRRC